MCRRQYLTVHLMDRWRWLSVESGFEARVRTPFNSTMIGESLLAIFRGGSTGAISGHPSASTERRRPGIGCATQASPEIAEGRIVQRPHSFFLPVRDPCRPQSTVQNDEEKRCRLVQWRGQATSLRRRGHNITVEKQKVLASTHNSVVAASLTRRKPSV